MGDNDALISTVIFSVFGDDGPVPYLTLFNMDDGIKVFKKDEMKTEYKGLDYGALLQISMKSISLLMGEHTYQDGEGLEEVRYFGILPFPDIKMDGLTYFFLIPDADARGSARAATITILISEKHRSFFYDYMNEFRHIVTGHSSKLVNMVDMEDFTSIIVSMLQDLNKFIGQINYPVPLKHNLKILFAGLDNSGKTSMILGLEKKYSKLINVKPTQGVSRTQSVLMGLTVSVWDLGGQEKYRDKYLKDSDLFLFDCDLIYYLVDVNDSERYEESIEYFRQIMTSLENFEENPPVIVCFHKMDPDKEDLPDVKKRIAPMREEFYAAATGHHVKFFETTIFEPYSLITAFSYGLVLLNPNKDLFTAYLQGLAATLNASSVILVNEQGIVVSEYADDDRSDRFFKLSIHHFTTLYKNFTKLVSRDASKAIYTLDDNLVYFMSMEIDARVLYLMLFLKDDSKLGDADKKITEFQEKITELFETYM